MKINHNKPPDGPDPSSLKKITDKSTVPGSPAAPADSINISQTSKQVQGLMDTISRLPEMRTEKVNAISESVKAGNYNVDSSKIAEKIVGEMT